MKVKCFKLAKDLTLIVRTECEGLLGLDYIEETRYVGAVVFLGETMFLFCGIMEF